MGSMRRLAPPSSSRSWALSAAPTGVQPGGEMLEAQDAGGNTQEVGDTEFERNEEVPSNSPGNQVGRQCVYPISRPSTSTRPLRENYTQRQIVAHTARSAIASFRVVVDSRPQPQVAASGMPGQGGSGTRQPAVEHAPG